MTSRRRFLIAFLLLAASGPLLIDRTSPARAAALTLQWVSPSSSSDIRIARKMLGTAAGPAQIDSGPATKFCPSSVTTSGGTHLSCQLPAADSAYQYIVCMRDAANEALGGFECIYQGNGGGWECTPVDIAASWCD